MLVCPTNATLEDWVAGRLTKQALVQHVESCAPCRQRVEAICANNALLAQLVGATPNTSAYTPDRAPDTIAPGSGEAIEGYEILSCICYGGQGVVYKAVQKATHRVVALKVLIEGAFASARQRLRFEREIDLVAGLRHPNIVTVYDGGTTPDGRLYYAMEYIHGQPLNEVLREHTASSSRGALPEDLRFLATVCRAVGYAHQRGIIHRDLKPANIFVDERGEPQILDFGLAKVAGRELTPEGRLLTVTGEFMGTLNYGAPEQLSGDPAQIDTRSDIYALGVTFYELLTGRLPYGEPAHVADLADRILRFDPPRPSTFRQELDDELDTIVLKMLHKDRERRYQSAGEVARDIERYLAGLPIDAKRDSGWYVIKKALRRHRVAVAVGAILLLTLTSALGVSTAARHRATRERDRAVAAEKRAEGVSAFLKDVFALANPLSARQTGSAIEREGTATFYAGRAGEVATVVDLLRAAVHRLDQSQLDPLADAELRRVLGSTLADAGQFGEAIAQLRKAVELCETSTGRDSAETLESLEHLCNALFLKGDAAEAIALAQPVYERMRKTSGPGHAVTLAFATLLGRSLEISGRPEEAIEFLGEVTDAAAAKVGPDSELVVRPRLELARILSNHDRSEESLRINRESVRALAHRPESRRRYARAAEGVAHALFNLGRFREAEEASREALSAYTAVYGVDHPLTAFQMVYLARNLAERGALQEALELAQRAVDNHERYVGPEHMWTYRAERCLARQMAGLAVDLERADELARHAAAGYARLYGPEHEFTLYAWDTVALVLLRCGRRDEAENIYRENVRIGSRAVQGWWYARYLQAWGLCLAEAGKREEAEVQLLGAWERVEKTIGADTEPAQQIARDLAHFYQAGGEDLKAREWSARAAPTSQPH